MPLKRPCLAGSEPAELSGSETPADGWMRPMRAVVVGGWWMISLALALSFALVFTQIAGNLAYVWKFRQAKFMDC